ncbi:MAG: FHA domain-containing protein [Spirochaetales bacterium]|nr:FHA domain-containing protein [Spirochaetales bacterium]MBP7263185.1 FHA domain-containing protein [Spirochaetia bacterium]
MPEDIDTIISSSNLGKRLSSIHKAEAYQLSYNGQACSLTARITIGRGTDNKIVLDDSLVSRHHALIQKIKSEFFIKDLDSSNGTFVNGQPVPKGKYVKLGRSDVISVGRTELRVM